MTASSLLTRSRSSGVIAPYFSTRPASASVRSCSSGVFPAGTSKCGSRSSPSGSLRSTFSAIHRVLERLLVVREKLAHLSGRPHEELGVIDHLQAVGRVDGLAALDADHGVLRLGVVGVDVMDVVRHDERNTGAT